MYGAPAYFYADSLSPELEYYKSKTKLYTVKEGRIGYFTGERVASTKKLPPFMGCFGRGYNKTTGRNDPLGAFMEQLRLAKGSVGSRPYGISKLEDDQKNQFKLPDKEKHKTNNLNPVPLRLGRVNNEAALIPFGPLVEEVYYVIWNGQIAGSGAYTTQGDKAPLYKKGALSNARWNQNILSKNWSYKQWNMNVQGNRYGSSWDYRNIAAKPDLDHQRSAKEPDDGMDDGIQYDMGYGPTDAPYRYSFPIPMRCGDGPVWWTPPSWVSLLKTQNSQQLREYLSDATGSGARDILDYYRKTIGVWEWNDQLVALGQQLMMSNFTRPFENYFFNKKLFQYNSGETRQVWRTAAVQRSDPATTQWPDNLVSGYYLSPLLQPSFDLASGGALQDVIKFLVKPDDMISDDAEAANVADSTKGLKRSVSNHEPQRPLLSPIIPSSKKTAHSKGVLMWNQDGKTIYLSTSATLYPLAGGDTPTPFGNTYGSVGKEFTQNDQQVLCVKYDYKNAFRLLEQLAKTRPETRLYYPSLSNIPSAWVTPPEQGALKPFFNIMRFFSKTSHLKNEPWWGPKDPWNPEVGLIKRILISSKDTDTGITANAVYNKVPFPTSGNPHFYWGPSKGARLCAKALSSFDIEMGGFCDLPALPPSMGGWHVPLSSSFTPFQPLTRHVAGLGQLEAVCRP